MEAEVAGAAAVAARVFVGGLTDAVAPADLEAIFAPAGRVRAVELVRTNSRNFAYVDLLCHSDKALAKLFSTYNGCAWKGGKLRVEKAKEHYLARLQREWAEDAASSSDDAKKQEEKRRPEKVSLDNTKINIYFPKLRKVKALPFKGTGKHKYSFRHVEVPPYPIHFCDCEEHCGPPEAANQVYASVLSALAFEKERNVMNSVMDKLFEKENEHDGDSGPLEIEKPDVAVDTTEPSDAADDLQMTEAEEPPEDDSDDLVINIGVGQPDNLLLQLKGEKQAVPMNKGSQFRKRKHLEEASSEKRQKSVLAVSEAKKKKESTSMMSDRRTAGKPSTDVLEAVHNQEISSGLTVERTDEFSSVLTRDKSSTDPQVSEARTGSFTKSESFVNAPASEPKKGSSWIQKSAWRDLVGEVGSSSFSMSQVLPNTNLVPSTLPNAAEPSALHAKSKRKVKFGEEASKSSKATTQTTFEQKFTGSTRVPSSGTAVATAAGDCEERKENNSLERARVVPKITIGEVCPFMRNAESEKQWSKAKKALTGFIKKRSDENTESNIKKGKPSSRR